MNIELLFDVSEAPSQLLGVDVMATLRFHVVFTGGEGKREKVVYTRETTKPKGGPMRQFRAWKLSRVWALRPGLDLHERICSLTIDGKLS